MVRGQTEQGDISKCLQSGFSYQEVNLKIIIAHTRHQKSQKLEFTMETLRVPPHLREQSCLVLNSAHLETSEEDN